MTNDSSTPIREFNVTKLQDLSASPTEETKRTVIFEKKIKPDLQPLLHKHRKPDPKNEIQTVANPTIKNINSATSTQSQKGEQYMKTEHECKMRKEEQRQLSASSEDNDRYLTEKEIDKIADMLHTIKKSDLDAIVDVYQLAQDIYKEVETITNEEIKNEAIHKLKEEEKHNSNIKNSDSKYWYDPLSNKGRAVNRDEIDLQSAYNVYSTLQPISSKPIFLNAELSKNEQAEKVHLYYPVTQFQRVSSYIHPTYKITTDNYNTDKNNEHFKAKMDTNNVPNSRKLIRPSHYLPYPFANIHQYNATESKNFYHPSPWMLDYYNKYKHSQPYYSTFISPVRKAHKVNTYVSIETREDKKPLKHQHNKENELVDTLLKNQKTQNWKTEPIPIEVLKDIRADIDTSRLLKAFPLRKKVKLEKVGTLINMDGFNQANRNKRFVAERVNDGNTADVEEFEAVLERQT